MNLELAGAEIPVSALSCFDTLSILMLVPVFDQFLYPYCKKIGYPLTMLQKIGTLQYTGYLFACLDYSITTFGLIFLPTHVFWYYLVFLIYLVLYQR